MLKKNNNNNNDKYIRVKPKTYHVRVAWLYDTPWYMQLTKKEIAKFETNPYVLDVLVLE